MEPTFVEQVWVEKPTDQQVTAINERGQFAARCKALFRQRLLTYQEYKLILATVQWDEQEFGRKSVHEVIREYDTLSHIRFGIKGVKVQEGFLRG